jgi:hypothetical protein
LQSDFSAHALIGGKFMFLLSYYFTSESEEYDVSSNVTPVVQEAVSANDINGDCDRPWPITILLGGYEIAGN